MLVKTIGSILIIGCSVIFGINQRSRLERRVKILEELISALDIMHSEISCMCTSTGELLTRICKITRGEVHSFFESCSQIHKNSSDMPFSLVWNRAVKESALELTPQEKQVLSELGNSLGRYNADETLRAILHTKRNLEGYLKCATLAREKLGKLYGNLSIISGVALVIILI